MPRFVRTSGFFWMLMLSTVLIFIGICLWSIPHYIEVTEAKLRGDIEQEFALLRRHADDQRLRVERLRASEFFQQPGSESDCRRYLNPRVVWERPAVHSIEELRAQLGSGPDTSPLALTEEETRACAAPWDAGIPDVVLNMETGWLGDLSTFDHWEPMLDSPASETDGPVERLPNYRNLKCWAKAAMVQGRPSFAEASGRVRHLAWLEITSETLVGLAEGVSMLKMEDRLAREQGPPAEWSALPPSLIEDAYKAVRYELSVATHCFGPCVEIRRTQLPPALECVVQSEAIRTLTLFAILAGEPLPKPPAGARCRFESARFVRAWALKSGIIGVRRAGERPGSFSDRVRLGAWLADFLMPQKVRALEAAWFVPPGFGARSALEPAR